MHMQKKRGFVQTVVGLSVEQGGGQAYKILGAINRQFPCAARRTSAIQPQMLNERR